MTYMYYNSQLRIAEADNTVQYWRNLGIQQSAIVIGPVSPFALVKCWADDGTILATNHPQIFGDTGPMLSHI